MTPRHDDIVETAPRLIHSVACAVEVKGLKRNQTGSRHSYPVSFAQGVRKRERLLIFWIFQIRVVCECRIRVHDRFRKLASNRKCVADYAILIFAPYSHHLSQVMNEPSQVEPICETCDICITTADIANLCNPPLSGCFCLIPSAV